MKKVTSITILKDTLLVCGSILLTLILLLTAEAMTRVLSDVSFLGNSKNLFIPNAFGKSKGNAKGVIATSFGVKVYTDDNGFRIPDKGWENAKVGNSVLIIGDSVAFGPGIREEKTFSGLLRKNNPELNIYNSSVIGYSTVDYLNLIKNIDLAALDVDQVFLFFCLNDIDTMSSIEIDKALSAPDNQEIQNGSDKQVPHLSEKGEGIGAFVSTLKKNMLVTKVNDFLRTNSKLYLLIKGILTDPQARYWYSDYRLYMQENDAGLQSGLQNIIDIDILLKNRGIEFTVIILPYEYQLRGNDASLLLPQKKIGKYFTKYGVNYFDSTTIFFQGNVRPKSYFLPYDPMHLSEKGHDLVYKAVDTRLSF